MKNIYLLLLFSFCFSFLNSQSINWVNFEKAEKLQKKSPEKLLLVNFYTEWCGWCRKMATSTLKDPLVTSLINNKYIPINFNAEDPNDYTFMGKDYKFIKTGRNGVNTFAYWVLNGRISFPSIALLDNKGKTVKVINGYQEVQQLLYAIK